MTFTKTTAREGIFRLARESGFDDPVSHRPVTSEVELSAVLALRSQMGLVKWDRVNFWAIDSQNDADRNARAKRTNTVVASVFDGRHVTTEYPLISTNDERTWFWHGMKADLLLLGRSRVALIENKIGAKSTGQGDDPEDGQLARQAKYLDFLGPELDRYLILISGYEFFNAYWESTQMRALVERRKSNRPERIKFRLLVWEQVIDPDWSPIANVRKG
jgi:hypothetical protein